MALTRKMLKAMGIEEEKFEQILDAHVETLNEIKDERDKYKADAEKLEKVQAELDQLKAYAAENDGKNPYEVKYNALKEDFENFKKDAIEKETARQTKEAYKELLRSAGVSEKRVESVLRVTDLKALKLDKDGKLEDAAALTDNIKTEWADFIETEGVKGADVPNPPKKEPQNDLDSLSDAEYYKQTYEAAKNK